MTATVPTANEFAALAAAVAQNTDDTAALLKALEDAMAEGAGKLAEDVHAHITTQATRIAALEAALAAKEMTEERIRELRKKYWETNEMGIFAGLSIALDIVRSLTPPEALARREAERRVLKAAQKEAKLVEELCDAVDRESEDIGGSPRGSAVVIREVGPANNELLEALAALDQN